jgi:SPP1 gp7 family putative phage head morphogenesis protein
MQQVRAERIEAGRKLHERGVPWSVISDYLGLGIKPFPGWDQAWLPFTLTSVGGLPEDDPAPVPAPERPTDSMAAITELEELLKGCPCHSQKPSRQANAGTAKRTAAAQKWEGYMKTRAPFVRRCRSGIDRALYVARKECLKKIAEAAASDSSDEGKAVRAPNGAFDYIFDLGTFETAMVTTVTSTSAAACQAGAEELLDTELPDAEVTFTADQAGLDALRARGNYIKDASNDIWTSVRDSLDEGIQAGESYAKLADRVRGEFNELSRTQSMRIAVTETSIAFETGRAGAMKAAGVQWKEWITAGDERVRASHVAMDGKTIPMDEPFQVGGASLMYPCDPSGPPGEVINCRCIHGPAQAPPGAPDPADIEGNNPDAGIPF